MSNYSLIQKLMARAFLDIRIASRQGETNICFALSDLFHNIPYQIITIQKTNGDYSEILDWLKTRAAQKNISSWLDNAINESVE